VLVGEGVRPTILSRRLRAHLQRGDSELGAETRRALDEESRRMRPPAVFVDLDGVLVDLMDGLFRLYGLTGLEGKLPRQSVTGWEPEPFVAQALGREVTRKELWGRVERAGPSFWATLHPLPWWNDVLAAAEAVGDVFLLTSPFSIEANEESATCIQGKIWWVKHHLPAMARRIITTHAKGSVVHPGSLLIDDGLHNVAAARDAGAEVVLWPAAWNRATFDEAIDVPAALEEIGEAGRRLTV
jgi:hypothetical protein